MTDEIVAQTDSEQIATAAERIAERATSLEGVSENARIAEKILGEPPSGTVIDVGTAANEVVAAARDAWPDVTIATDIETPLPVKTGVEITDALENLVENAIVHNTGERSVRVTAQKRTPIHASTRGSGQYVTIAVKDNGPGIPQHERAVVFDEEDMTQLKHGSGLGLWIVRWITESANGSVTHDRRDGWTTLKLRLPLATEDPNIELTNAN
jgi:signal transduction histidine kinase